METSVETESTASTVYTPSLFGKIIAHGWLQLKIRSLVNVRPRHHRYCVLSKEAGILSSFKFQPSSGDMATGVIKPLRAYRVKSVGIWSARKFGILLTVIQQTDQVERVLEVITSSDESRMEWLHACRVITREEEEREGEYASVVMFPITDTSLAMSQCLQPVDLSVVRKGRGFLLKGASIHRGLLNNAGENNCFLNVIIQSFWHLQSMRQFLLNAEIRMESVTVEANVLRALQSIMREYDSTSTGVLHSRALRKGLSVLYKADRNFQEGMMYDAEETLLALLNLMHQQTDATKALETRKAKSMVTTAVGLECMDEYAETAEAVFDPNSIPHVVFSHQIYDRCVCDVCHYTSAWDLYSNLVFTTYAIYSCNYSFSCMEDMLRFMSSADVSPTCDIAGCSGRYLKQRCIQRLPMVFAISLLWATDCASTNQIKQLLLNISDRLDLARAFDIASSVEKSRHDGVSTLYHLRGFVCYYGRHYVAIFYSTAHMIWLLFDDSRVIELGNWNHVVAQCLQGRFQPVLVFYEMPNYRHDSSVDIFRNSNLASSEHSDASASKVSLQASDTSTKSQISLSPTLVIMRPRTITMNSPLKRDEYDVSFADDKSIIGMYLEKVANELCVTSFPRGTNDELYGAEKSGQVELFDILIYANGHAIDSYSVDKAMQVIKAQQRPLIIRFRRSFRVRSLCEMGFTRDIAIEALEHCKGDVQAAANYCSEKHKEK